VVPLVSRNNTVTTFCDIIEAEVNTDLTAIRIVAKLTVPFTKRILTTALKVREVINSYICVFKVLKII
jgi:hypothetical protein